MSLQQQLALECLADAVPRQGSEKARTADRWDSEVVIVHGRDRTELAQQVRKLTEQLERDPATDLRDLAFTLNTSLPAGGSRLAVVADSLPALVEHLRRAGPRLSDPKCRQIRDTQGIYFFDQPLYPAGKVALLFPGEGAQYVGMLADLVPHFPEMGQHLELCDRHLLQAGHRDQPFSRVFMPPADATAAERAVAEKELFRLSSAMCSVLMVDSCIYETLRRLGLPVQAVVGHSSGELPALAAAGCLEAGEQSYIQVLDIAHAMQQRQDEVGGDGFLLAVGAGRKAVDELLAQAPAAAGGPVFVAMDNCPHQTILAGPVTALGPVEGQLRAGGVVCERLPFNRPYHTPLFEPFLQSIAAAFQAWPLRPAQIPVYSCATGQPFPNDPAAIRRLAIQQWALPVEFRRVIEAMYADGVRIFVEAGPRGNLTAFVEDTLRGRPCAALAANLPHRSGTRQLNHLVAQLAAHHVPLDLTHLYARRQPRRLELTARPGRAATKQPEGDGPRKHATQRTAVLNRHWAVMERFLQVQQQVMHQWLGGRQRRQFAQPAPSASEGETVPSLALGAGNSDLPAWPLLGEVIRHQPGRELVMRRRMDPTEDLYALDHTLGGRDASAIDARHNGLPVMPMAFSMEMMAQTAAVLIPGQNVVGLRSVALRRWIPLDREDHTVLEIAARVVRPGEVAVAIRDLGTLAAPSKPETLVVEGTVLLADRFPEPPSVGAMPLTRPRPCRYNRDQLYDQERRLFHGPIFQAVDTADRQGDEGIQGHLRTQSHSGLFRSTAEPNLFTDPILIDASTHLLGCWHLDVTDQTGRVVFPYQLGSVAFHGPRPAEGTRVECRVQIGATTARQVSHQIDLLDRGRLWCRIERADYWRFYLPPTYVDFFRRHQDYLLGERWAPDQGSAGTRFIRLVPPPDMLQPAWRLALAHVAMSPAEYRRFRELGGTSQRQTDWLFGRLAAKDAVRDLWRERTGERLFPADLEIETDAHGQPHARRRGPNASDVLPAISIAHAGGVMMALAAFDRPVGIDLEPIQARKEEFEEIAFDAAERQLLDAFGVDRDEGIARFWCAREAVAKALGRGLAEGPRSVAVRAHDRASGVVQVVLGPLLAEAFPHLAPGPIIARTVREDSLVVAWSFAERAGHANNHA